jgi:hypothetical protein
MALLPPGLHFAFCFVGEEFQRLLIPHLSPKVVLLQELLVI